jgi:hypothetical protein
MIKIRCFMGVGIKPSDLFMISWLIIFLVGSQLEAAIRRGSQASAVTSGGNGGDGSSQSWRVLRVPPVLKTPREKKATLLLLLRQPIPPRPKIQSLWK